MKYLITLIATLLLVSLSTQAQEVKNLYPEKISVIDFDEEMIEKFNSKKVGINARKSLRYGEKRIDITTPLLQRNLIF